MSNYMGALADVFKGAIGVGNHALRAAAFGALMASYAHADEISGVHELTESELTSLSEFSREQADLYDSICVTENNINNEDLKGLKFWREGAPHYWHPDEVASKREKRERFIISLVFPKIGQLLDQDYTVTDEGKDNFDVLMRLKGKGILVEYFTFFDSYHPNLGSSAVMYYTPAAWDGVAQRGGKLSFFGPSKNEPEYDKKLAEMIDELLLFSKPESNISQPISWSYNIEGELLSNVFVGNFSGLGAWLQEGETIELMRKRMEEMPTTLKPFCDLNPL